MFPRSHCRQSAIHFSHAAAVDLGKVAALDAAIVDLDPRIRSAVSGTPDWPVAVLSSSKVGVKLQQPCSV